VVELLATPIVTGALHSPRGHAVIAGRSWHERSDSSTIVPRLTPARDFLSAFGGGDRAGWSGEIFGLNPGDARPLW
jgi:hypothetical protein